MVISVPSDASGLTGPDSFNPSSSSQIALISALRAMLVLPHAKLPGHLSSDESLQFWMAALEKKGRAPHQTCSLAVLSSSPVVALSMSPISFSES